MRYSALLVAEAVYGKLGEEFTVLLPETIPFLAEVMEGMSYTWHTIVSLQVHCVR